MKMLVCLLVLLSNVFAIPAFAVPALPHTVSRKALQRGFTPVFTPKSHAAPPKRFRPLRSAVETSSGLSDSRPSSLLDVSLNARPSTAQPVRIQQNKILLPTNINAMKFGGTSVGSASRMKNVANIVLQSIKLGSRPIVVLSAMSSTNKSIGTTSRLLEVASLLKAIALLETIHAWHVKEIKEALRVDEIKLALLDQIDGLFQSVAAHIKSNSEADNRDYLMSLGEELSSRIFTSVLLERGVKAEYIDLSHVITKQYKSVSQEMYDEIVQYIRSRLEESYATYPNTVFVIGGYFGTVPNTMIDSIGRGYTDFTAALTAKAANAAHLSIYKEVDGVYTTETARILGSISLAEAEELAKLGAEVIHPSTIKQVPAETAIKVLNTFNSDAPGTNIELGGHASKCGRAAAIQENTKLLVIENIHNQIDLQSFLERLQVPIEFYAFDRSTVKIVVQSGLDLESIKKTLHSDSSVSLQENFSMISVVGLNLKSNTRIRESLQKALEEAGIHIEAVIYNREHSISFLVERSMGVEALKVVHQVGVVALDCEDDCNESCPIDF